MSEKFTPVEIGDKQLYLPVEDASKWAQNPDHQEMMGQKEVFGTDGHGSIRAEVRDRQVSSAEDLDRSIDDMLDPKNVIDLKDSLERSTQERISEGVHAVDKRLDKDGSKAISAKMTRDELKESLIESYVQTGADPEAPRDVPQRVKDEISRMLDMTFDDLEKRMQKNAPADTGKDTSINDNGGVGGNNYGPERPVGEGTGSGTEHGDQGTGQNNSKNDDTDKKNPGYDGPVEKGKEIELYTGDDDGGEQDPIVKTVESDPEKVALLFAHTDKYAYETAKSRKSYLGRFASTDSRVSKILRKTPILGRMLNGINKRTDKAVVESKNNYIETRNTVGAEAAVKLREAGYSEEEIGHLSVLGRMEWDSLLEDGTSVIQELRIQEYGENGGEITEEILDSAKKMRGIVGHRHEQGKDSTKFSDWWHKQKGIKGVVKRYGPIFATGLAAGALLPATLSAIAGVGLTAGSLELARRMNARRANSDSGAGADGAKVTWAEMQSIADKYSNELGAKGNWFDDQGNFLTDQFDLEANGGFDSTIATTEKRTNEEMTKNRRKVVATALSTLGGWGAGEVIDWVSDSDLPNFLGDEGEGGGDGGDGETPSPDETPDTGEGEPTPDLDEDDPRIVRNPEPIEPTGETPLPADPELQGVEGFNVEHGNGFTHEIQDFAEANGMNLSSEQAYEVYKDTFAKFGEDGIISTDTYLENGDLRISAPGTASWSPDAAQFMFQRMQELAEAEALPV